MIEITGKVYLNGELIPSVVTINEKNQTVIKVKNIKGFQVGSAYQAKDIPKK